MVNNSTNQQICKVCGHLKSEHRSHIGPDHTGQKINHVGCNVVVKREDVDFMKEFGISSLGHSCSCHGVKENTYLQRGIDKYRKFLRGLPKTNDNLYKRKEIESQIRRLKKSIKENPLNLLHWQKEIITA